MEERAKAVEESDKETSLRKALAKELETTKSEMDKALAILNGQLAEERGKLVRAFGEKDTMAGHLQEIEGAMKEVADRSAEEVRRIEAKAEEDKRAIARATTADSIDSSEKARQWALWGVQLLYGPVDLSPLEAEDEGPVPEGVDVFSVEEEHLKRAQEEMGVTPLARWHIRFPSHLSPQSSMCQSLRRKLVVVLRAL